MKVKITEQSRKILNVSELPQAKQIVNEMREEEIMDYAPMAARIASGMNESFEILKTEAEISKNFRADDAYFSGSKTLDVWLRIYAYSTYAGFYEIGVYLTDLWNVTGDNSAEIRNHMFILEFKRKV